MTRQEEDARALAAARGWDVVAVLVDNDLSAAAGKRARPGFEALIGAMERREVGAVLAWDLSRLTRNARDRLRLIEVGRAAEVVVALVRGSDLDLSTPAGRLTADILASVAQHEIEQKSDRQRRAVRQAVEQGRRIGGRRPFGYEPNGVTVRESEAEHVRRAFEAVLAGVPVAAVARALTEAGVLTSQGSARWHPSVLRDLLLNPRYAGLRGHGSVPERGRRTIVVHGPAQWPALVPEPTWRAARDLLTAPERRTPPRGGTAFLTGWCFCGVCGAHVHGGRESASARRTIRCSATAHLARRAEPVEAFVADLVIARLSRPDAADVLVAQTPGVDLDALRAETLALHNRLDEAAGMFARGALTGRQLERLTSEVRAQIATAEATMADAGRVSVLGPLVTSGDVRAAWEALDMPRRRAVASTLLEVRIHPPGRGVRAFDPRTVETIWRTA